jgi:uncharacterized protein
MDLPSPVATEDRVEELDVLRGVALFGVFLMNFVGFAGIGVMATSQQLFTLPTAPLDFTLLQICEWLVHDKANTLFAFLFGLGFSLQMQRLEARGADFERIYRRRLLILLVIGIAHNFLLWAWDILHVYALAGFALLAVRRVATRRLLVWGLLLAAFGRTMVEVLAEFGGLGADLPNQYSDERVEARQALSLAGNYFGLVRIFAEYYWFDFVASGMLIGWLLYAFGRFLLGAYVGRRGWLQNAQAHLPGFRRVLRLTLPAGLILEGIAHIVAWYGQQGRLPEWDHWEFLGETLHLLAVPLLAAGYLCAIVVGLHTPLGKRLLAPFAYAGRMALTNYVLQSFVYAFVLFGFGPGLTLAGRIGTLAVVALVVIAYAVQILLSRWWLARFAYGPLEWVWRALTYGRWPRLSIA